MPLLRRTVTPARLAANRRSALRSTGPRTREGKSRSSLNALRRGGRSKTIDLLWDILYIAPPCKVITMARSRMTPGQLAHPRVQYMLDFFWSSEEISRYLGGAPPPEEIEEVTNEA